MQLVCTRLQAPPASVFCAKPSKKESRRPFASSSSISEPQSGFPLEKPGTAQAVRLSAITSKSIADASFFITAFFIIPRLLSIPLR